MELFIASRHVTDEEGRPHHFYYYLTIEVIDAGNFCCENYGVRITEPGIDTQVIPSLTASAMRIDQLMTTLVDNAVGPVGLRDIIEDWI